MITLTPKRLITLLDKRYGYNISEQTAKTVLTRCEAEYDNYFNESELIEIVEEYLN